MTLSPRIASFLRRLSAKVKKERPIITMESNGYLRFQYTRGKHKGHLACPVVFLAGERGSTHWDPATCKAARITKRQSGIIANAADCTLDELKRHPTATKVRKAFEKRYGPVAVLSL